MTKLNLSEIEARAERATPWDEMWAAIPGYDGYQVSDQGNIRSILKKGNHKSKKGSDWRLLKPQIRKDNRRTISIATKGVYRHHFIYKLIMLAFLGPCPDGMEIAHLNGNCSDDRFVNLKYCTHKENESHKHMHGTSPQGERNPNSKLLGWQIEEILFLSEKSISHAKIAALFDISYKDVSAIILGIKWSHIKAREDIPALIACIKEMKVALEFYSHEDSVLGGSDYQHYATSSSRIAFDDDGKNARSVLSKWFGEGE